jgi:cytochrome c oxidase assembly factor CtaG
MLDMVAVAIPPQGGVWTVLAQWRFDPVTVGSLLAAASLYALGLIRLHRVGRSFLPGASLAFFCGMATLVVGLCSPVDGYADVSYSVHMAQHLILTLAAPPLLALGAPITLALRVSSPATARRIARVLRGRVASFLASPVVGWVLFVGVAYVVHLSPLFDAALRSNVIHALEHALWLGAALIFWWPIVGRDPSPHPMAYPTRLLSLFLTMPAMSFLALVIYTARAPMYPTYAGLPAPWGPMALVSQQDAAVLMWLVGGAASMVAMLVVAAAWKRDEDARQRRIEEREDALAVDASSAPA